MESIEVIEEKKMIKRLLGKFLINVFTYGIVYVACMIIFLMFAIFQDESFMSLIMMALINIAINFGFMVSLSSSSINSAFTGINTVNVPAKSRVRLLKIVGFILLVVMILITVLDVFIFHILFRGSVQSKEYTMNAPKTTYEVITELERQPGEFVLVRKVGDNEFLITSRIYSREAIIITVSIIVMNILIVLGVVNYENKLLKKYLVT